MKTKPYKILNAFGAPMSMEEYLKKKMAYKVKGKWDVLFNMCDIYLCLADGNYITLYHIDRRKFVYKIPFGKECLLFPGNHFDCYKKGEFINKNLITCHTGKYEKTITLYMPCNYISEIAESQRSRYIDFADLNIPIIALTEEMKAALIIWRDTGRQEWIDK